MTRGPVLAAVLAAAALPALAHDLPPLNCEFDRTCTTAEDCTADGLSLTLRPRGGENAILEIAGRGARAVQMKYDSGMLNAVSPPGSDGALWMLTLPDWPAEDGAVFGENWPVEARVKAWLGHCDVAENVD